MLDLASTLVGESHPAPQPLPSGRQLLAVCGAHLSGEPLDGVLTQAGAPLHCRTRTAPGYQMVRIEGGLPRPGLLDTGNGPAGGIDIELWDSPDELIRQLAVDTDPPLAIDRVRLEDGSSVAGFVAMPSRLVDAQDISTTGGWRAHLAAIR